MAVLRRIVRSLVLRGAPLGAGLAVALAVGCGGADVSGAGRGADGGDWSGAGGSGGGGGNGCTSCPAGFHCEFNACVPDEEPPHPAGEGRSPLTSLRYLFTLQVDARRLVRIDSSTLEVEAFPAGLAPMDLGVVGSRELSILLDAYDLVEVLDHRGDEVHAAAWETARSLSHIALSPTGDHAVLYYDWDDPRAQERQPQPGNINQVTVLALHDRATGPAFLEEDPRAIHLAVGFLPRDVRFSEDGTRAVVISRDVLTPITLGDPFDGVLATLQTPVDIVDVLGEEVAPAEILLDPTARWAILRSAGSARVDVLDLEGGPTRCYQALGPVHDVALDGEGRLLVLADDGLGDGGSALSITALGAAADPCLALAADITLTSATQLAVDRTNGWVTAYEPRLAVERLWRVELDPPAADSLRLEKAVAAVAYSGEEGFLLVSHLKAPGAPAWNPAVEDPDESVDKSHGVSWVDLISGGHRLEVSDHPFGAFTFVPAQEDEPGATLQARLDPARPQLLRVTHRAGFDERRIDLAGQPEDLGYLSATSRAFATQAHPWGRVTFMDPQGEDLRHVTGFAISGP